MSVNLQYAMSRTQMENLVRAVALGVENSARGLSGMVGKQIGMASPMLTVAPLSQVALIVGSPENVVVGVNLYFDGDVTGYIVLILSDEQACRLIDILMDMPAGSTRTLDSMARSALGEAGNIVGSFFLNALAEVTGLLLMPSPPAVLIDMCGAILDLAVTDIAQDADEALMIETIITLESKQITGHFLVLPKPASFQALLQALS